MNDFDPWTFTSRPVLPSKGRWGAGALGRRRGSLEESYAGHRPSIPADVAGMTTLLSCRRFQLPDNTRAVVLEAGWHARTSYRTASSFRPAHAGSRHLSNGRRGERAQAVC